jgi:high-affinity nickel-transport protein
MSFVDSLDSVLMLYAYASPSRSTPEGKIGLFQSTKIELDEEADRLVLEDVPASTLPEDDSAREGVAEVDPAKDSKAHAQVTEDVPILPIVAADQGTQSPSGPGNQAIDKKTQVISSLSVTLTALSIIVALR